MAVTTTNSSSLRHKPRPYYRCEHTSESELVHHWRAKPIVQCFVRRGAIRQSGRCADQTDIALRSPSQESTEYSSARTNSFNTWPAMSQQELTSVGPCIRPLRHRDQSRLRPSLLQVVRCHPIQSSPKGSQSKPIRRTTTLTLGSRAQSRSIS